MQATPMAQQPSFIIIGAGKCGTTSLHSYLQQHPQIYICPKKETFFFINEASRASHRKWGAVESLEAYLSLFESAPAGAVIGEISTNYYRYPESAQQIHDLLPDVKIIAILRNPAERAFSSYQMFVREGHETAQFEDILTADNHYVNPGFYYRELTPFFEVFERQQIKILLYDDLCQNPTSFMQDLCRFIGVDEQVALDMSQRQREGGIPKHQGLYALLTRPNPLRGAITSVLKLAVPLELRQQWRLSLVKKTTQKARLSASARQQLLTLYHSDILQLQDLIGRDLSSWLQ
jgi:Sulfotransferase domain